MTNPEIPPEFPGGEDPRAGSTDPVRHQCVAVPPAPYIICVAIFLLVYVLFSSSPLVSLLGTFVAIIPAALAGIFIVRLATPELPKEFYIEQVFFGVVPGFILSFIAELVLGFIAAGALLGNDVKNAVKNNPNLKPKELVTAIVNEMAVWKVVVLALLTAFVLAGGVEETTKLVIGLRAKKLAAGGARDIGLSAHSVVVSVMCAALGLASTEHLFYTVRMFSEMPSLLGATVLSLLRGVLAFPVHCGTALIIGVALAKNVVLQTGVKVWPAFLLAVFIHGSFDAVAMVIAALVGKGVLPKSPWFGVGILVADVLITVALMLYCRSIYRSLGGNAGYETIESESAV